MKKFEFGDREFVITDEMETMGEKVEKIFEETFPFGFNYPRGGELSDSTLKEFGNWIYNHMHDYEKASKLIYLMLYSFFNEHERNVVWGAFDKNVDADFSEVMTYLLNVLIKSLSEYPGPCRDIVYNFVKDEAQTSESINFKYCAQSHLSENVKSIAEDIVKGEVAAPDDIKQQCVELLKYTTDYFGISSRYICYLIGKNELFPEVINTIFHNYC